MKTLAVALMTILAVQFVTSKPYDGEYHALHNISAIVYTIHFPILSQDVNLKSQENYLINNVFVGCASSSAKQFIQTKYS